MNKKLIFTPIIIGLISPSLVIFYLQVFVADYTITASLSDIMSHQFAAGHNLFLLAFIGLIPFALLSVILFYYEKKNSKIKTSILMFSGLIGILMLMLPAHYSIWYPLYEPNHMSSTAVIAFLFIPIYCVLTMFIGIFIGTKINKIKGLNKNYE